jgi:arsenite methyltransferase
MSPDMLERARKNAEKTSLANAKFVLAPITATHLEPSSADCIISNCVVNLLPDTDKIECFREIFKLLKPGGRLAITDILAKKPIPKELRDDIALYVGCISGASLANNYEEWLKEAGFQG